MDKKMKDKEKQIEEIQNALPHIEVIKAMYGDIDFARYLYDHNCRIITEDSVVLSREEWKQIKNSLYYSKEALEKKLQQASKETAEKIFKELKVKLKGYIGLNYLDELAKQFGVEIKE